MRSRRARGRAVIARAVASIANGVARVLPVPRVLRRRGIHRRLLEVLGQLPAEDPDKHPERLAVLPYCVGRGIDVGCGYRKTTADCIGIDLLPRGTVGEHGVMAGRSSA